MDCWAVLVENNVDKEIIMRYDEDVQSNGIFYTDVNGREVLEPKRVYRPITWNYTVHENVSGELLSCYESYLD